MIRINREMTEPGPELTPEERERYARHMLLPEVGIEGQRRLKGASVLCLGVGGLGSPAALYLAAAGVGRIGLMDPDVVERSNLQRQVLHGTADIGRGKLESARARLSGLNPNVRIDLHDAAFAECNALELVAGYDVIVNATDNLRTRYLSSDACAALARPDVYGAVSGFQGQCTVLAPHLGGPCYRCLFPEPPAADARARAARGVLGAVAGVIGALQAVETLKLLLGAGEPLIGRMLHLDALRFRFRELQVCPDPSCPVCRGGAAPVRRPAIPATAP